MSDTHEFRHDLGPRRLPAGVPRVVEARAVTVFASVAPADLSPAPQASSDAGTGIRRRWPGPSAAEPLRRRPPTGRMQLRGRRGDRPNGTYEEYHPFGSASWWATKSGTQVSAKRYRYTGKEKDEETGLSYHGARFYAPWLGRWASADPALANRNSNGRGLVFNAYGYADGRPIVSMDPDGREPQLIGKIYFAQGSVDGSMVQYTGHTAQEIRDRFSTHKWKAFLRDESTVVKVYDVHAELDVEASGRRSYLSARKEALSSAEQDIKAAHASKEFKDLNAIEPAHGENAKVWRERHAVRVADNPRRFLGGRLAYADATISLYDAWRISIEFQRERYIFAPYILQDEEGRSFTLTWEDGWFSNRYTRQYIDGKDGAEATVEISKSQFNTDWSEARARFGYFRNGQASGYRVWNVAVCRKQIRPDCRPRRCRGGVDGHLWA